MRVARGLVCLRYGIGDLVMELPVLQALRGFMPEARITALGARPAIELLENDDCVDELVGVQEFGFSHWGDPGTQANRRSFQDWLLQNRFDLVLDPSHAAMGAREMIRHNHRMILDSGDRAQDEALAMGEDGVGAIKAAVHAGWGLKIAAGELPVMRPSAAEHALAARFMQERGLACKTILGFSPVASSALKRWPVERLAAVADSLLTDSFEAALLFCGPQRQIASRLLGYMRHRHRVEVIADVHLRQAAALLGRCRLFICNDTGLLHLAAAMRVRVLGIFGPTSAGIYLPPGGAVAAEADDFCPHRKKASFGPPACLVEDRCLEGGGRCIERIEFERVLSLLNFPGTAGFL